MGGVWASGWRIRGVGEVRRGRRMRVRMERGRCWRPGAGIGGGGFLMVILPAWMV